MTLAMVTLCATAQDNNKEWWEDYGQNGQTATQGQAGHRDGTIGSIATRFTENNQHLATNASVNYNVDKGFAAGNDIDITLAYDQLQYRLRNADGDKNPYTLHGLAIGSTMHAQFGKPGNSVPIGLEAIYLLRYAGYKDVDGEGGTTVKQNEFGIQMGFLLAVGYHFSKHHYLTLAAGPKIDATICDWHVVEYSDGSKIRTDMVMGSVTAWDSQGNKASDSSNDLKLRRAIDFPISFGATLRLNRIGIGFHYDLGLMDRNKDRYYTQYGLPKDKFKLQKDHMYISLHFYPGSGLNQM